MISCYACPTVEIIYLLSKQIIYIVQRFGENVFKNNKKLYPCIYIILVIDQRVKQMSRLGVDSSYDKLCASLPKAETRCWFEPHQLITSRRNSKSRGGTRSTKDDSVNSSYE